ncbi:helix-turn-helix domain-containing protein (plasmid) [Latilactobacillus sp. 5-91]|uniref:helix-turn-helix domain-containing protein n=1 Tax=Latilactobacillus sp. 5-91 TaxID=3410924 RepID=UPI003C746609
MNIGDRIKEQRLKKGWTQDFLANLLMVSRSTVSGWEVGRNYPDLDTIVALSDLFNLSLDKLLRENPIMVKETSKKTKRFKFYKIVSCILGLMILVYVGYNQKLRHDENTYRSNLVTKGWHVTDKDRSSGNEYELKKHGISYWTYIVPAGLTGVPLSEQKVNVIVKKSNLIVNVIDNTHFEIIIYDKNIDFSARVNVDKNVKVLSFDKKATPEKKTKIKEYLLKYKTEYQEMIHEGTKERNGIIHK